jgi:HSP20 family molecular chaperone IbpA
MLQYRNGTMRSTAVRRANGVRCRFSADTLSPKIDVAESKDAIDMTAELSGFDETNG